MSTHNYMSQRPSLVENDVSFDCQITNFNHVHYYKQSNTCQSNTCQSNSHAKALPQNNHVHIHVHTKIKFIISFPLGTDRHNIVEADGTTENYPKPWEQNTMWNAATLIWKNDATWVTNSPPGAEDLAAAFASSGYYGCYRANVCPNSVETKTSMQQLLNNVSPSFEGAVLKFSSGTYNYFCSRNNNFTNRSQKGVLKVTSAS